MISENSAKLIRSLVHKKYRYKHNFFIAEGKKIILDILKTGFDEVNEILVSDEIYKDHEFILGRFKDKINICTPKDFAKISNLESPPDIILIGTIPSPLILNSDYFNEGIHLYLDQIQDPGNVGTIFRTAEWFGVKSIGLSEGCADFVHPKVIQASMGSFCRMKVWTGDIHEMNIDKSKIFGADLAGSSLYDSRLPKVGILVIGNEGQGISEHVRNSIGSYIHIPSFSNNIDSLNAANAAAIILSEWRRQTS